jgi:pimeloyl-ACP methyl ester carboxylesterase
MADLSENSNRIEVESSSNTSAYCWTVGDKNKPPLFLVSGFTGTHTDLMTVANGLTQKYFVIVPDMPGWGESPRFAEKLTIENYTAYVKSLFDQLGISQITYVGHCMGGTLGIEFVNQFPEKIKQLFLITTPYLSGTLYNKLLVFDTDLALRFPKRIRPLFYLWRNRYFGAVANIFIIKVVGKMRKLKLIIHYVIVQGQPNEDSIEEAWFSMIHYNYKKLANVKSPVHIIHGNEDILTTKGQMEKLHQFLPSATVDFVLHAGHMPPIENPQGVAEAILKY